MTLFKGNSFDLLPFSFKNVAYCISKSMFNDLAINMKIAWLFIHPVSNVEKNYLNEVDVFELPLSVVYRLIIFKRLMQIVFC